MKKKLLLLFSAFLVSFQSFAQTNDDGPENESEGLGPYIGLIGAFNNTWIIIDNEYANNEHHKHKATFGPAAGLVLGYKFNERHSAQIEGFYSKQGAKFDLTNDNNDKVIGSKEIDLHYFAVPLLFKLSGMGKTRFNVHFGPQFAFLLSGREENTFDQDVTETAHFNDGTPAVIPKGTYLLASTDAEDRKKAGITGDFNKVDPSVVLGFGVEQDLTDQLYLSANLRFNYAFKGIRNQETVRDAYNADEYTLRYNVLGGLQIGIHYFFQKQ